MWRVVMRLAPHSPLGQPPVRRTTQGKAWGRALLPPLISLSRGGTPHPPSAPLTSSKPRGCLHQGTHHPHLSSSPAHTSWYRGWKKGDLRGFQGTVLQLHL